MKGIKVPIHQLSSRSNTSNWPIAVRLLHSGPRLDIVDLHVYGLLRDGENNSTDNDVLFQRSNPLGRGRSLQRVKTDPLVLVGSRPGAGLVVSVR